MKTLSIVIPVYNEVARLPKTFKALKEGFIFYGIKLEEVIFVDDGSTDKTKLKIRNAKSEIEEKLKAPVKIISYQSNRGKGYAVKTGMLASESDYTLFFDADMSTPLSEFKKFLPLIEKNDPVIIGTRKNCKSTVMVPQPKYRQWLGQGFTLLSNIILNTRVTDFTCGFKVFSKQAKNAIFGRSIIERWGFDAEILFLARKLSFKISEKAVLWYDDRQTKVNLLKDIPGSFKELMLIRVNYFRYKPLTLQRPAIKLTQL